MKFVSSSIIVSLLVLFISACGGGLETLPGAYSLDKDSVMRAFNEKAESDPDLKAMASFVKPMFESLEYDLVLGLDGRFEMKVTTMGQENVVKGTFIVEGNRLVATPGEGAPTKTPLTMEIDGNRLVFKEEGMPSELYFKKK